MMPQFSLTRLCRQYQSLLCRIHCRQTSPAVPQLTKNIRMHNDAVFLNQALPAVRMLPAAAVFHKNTGIFLNHKKGLPH